MALSGRVPDHPATFSTRRVGTAASMEEVLEDLIDEYPLGLLIFDPFAGTGAVLGPICRRLGRRVDGVEIELDPALGGSYRGTEAWVRFGDAFEAASYPRERFVVSTSCCYTNRISTDYVNGPTPATKLAGRTSYGTSLGRALHPNNLARAVDRSGRDGPQEAFYGKLGAAIAHWGEHVLLNVDAPMSAHCQKLLASARYRIEDVVDVLTPRLRGVANAGDRAEHEVVIVAAKESAT